MEKKKVGSWVETVLMMVVRLVGKREAPLVEKLDSKSDHNLEIQLESELESRWKEASLVEKLDSKLDRNLEIQLESELEIQLGLWKDQLSV
jgi:hypothetical protein